MAYRDRKSRPALTCADRLLIFRCSLSAPDSAGFSAIRFSAVKVNNINYILFLENVAWRAAGDFEYATEAGVVGSVSVPAFTVPLFLQT
jgi:hypothetical protein